MQEMRCGERDLAIAIRPFTQSNLRVVLCLLLTSFRVGELFRTAQKKLKILFDSSPLSYRRIRCGANHVVRL